ncbi:MAG: DISARM system phospholipase D-like protein DrmC [Blastocatellia bacterium]
MARNLPFSLIRSLAALIANCNFEDWLGARARILQTVSNPHYRPLVAKFLDAWRPYAENVPPKAVALALTTAAQCEKEHRENQSIEPVWTGPEVGGIPLRRTEQGLLELLDSATERILIVSYAVYNIPRIGEALIRSASRGVDTTLIIETPDRIVGRSAFNTLKELGPSVAARCNVYFWPLEQRATDGQGKPGILHVKCAVADGRRLFLSSANLTDYAFKLNMELGLLITGGALPKQVEGHFHQMIQMGVFAKI